MMLFPSQNSNSVRGVAIVFSLCVFFAFGSAAYAQTASIVIDAPDRYVGTNWTLSIVSSLPNQPVLICARVNGGASICTAGDLLPNPGPSTTDASGNWSTSGQFGTGDVASWEEWAQVGGVESNHLYFSVEDVPSVAAPFSFNIASWSLVQGFSFWRILCTWANWAVTFGFLLAVIVIGLSAVRMATSAGDESRLRKGKQMLMIAIIGFFVLLFAKVAIVIFLAFLGLPLTSMRC